VNIIFESRDRSVLAEPLAFELYRRAGSPACRTEFVRLHIDDQLAGYHLLVEQVNSAFLRSNQLDANGDLYKLNWYEIGLEGQHERKGDPDGGHTALVDLVEQLKKTDGEEQWKLIEHNFKVSQVATYFAVNMALSHWDGFFNNYFAHRDGKGESKWRMFPWDQDMTWGSYHTLPDDQDFTDMLLTFGMEGDRPLRSNWWRPGGVFSSPLLANPIFRRKFLKETKRILEDIYSEENYFPVIDQLATQLRPEISVRATIIGELPATALARFDRNLESLKRHLKKRRAFLLDQEEIMSLSN